MTEPEPEPPMAPTPSPGPDSRLTPAPDSDAGPSPEPGWVPEACTLPTEERPLRLAEWDGLFATQVAAPSRPVPSRVRLRLPGGAESASRVRELAERESDCCSFFEFGVTADGPSGDVLLTISVDQAHEGVLNALAARAAEAAAHQGRGERPPPG
ncbi:hypothetical protein H181DRAFT_03335 [Streptomyces sp. WMMB 714]|uniref:hypothetical protein n=1 Tax=Streptomyces sp. WMMB 714 TaxID=1286822 RepID=UPI000823F4E5|nr:hypothetical protein [Streptomyces sp. WMMB 714]SCK39144.1 hypothetical protein H181DRAFT_03335 [Streptomyces sp. WMMB 714]